MLRSALQPALSGVLPLEALREGAVQWLAAHQGWLLILDNVTDPADVAPLLARAPAGRYLITSRRATGWHATAVPVRLDVLDPGEAQALLTAILTQDQSRQVDGVGELCADLGFLPLAVEQAGAYLAQAGVTAREYLDLLARYPAAMYQASAEGGDAARTIARIWHVTLDRLADDPLAGQVLRILAWYAPEAIPRALLDGLADPPALLRAVGRLAAYSMLTADAGTLAMHRLVQAVTRTPDPGDPHRDPQAVDDARNQATRQLTDTLPDPEDPAGWPTWRMLLPHIDALASHAPPDADTETTVHLLNQAGAFLLYQGQPARAAGHLQRALADSVRILGQDHPQTLIARGNLTLAYQTAGDLGRAIPLHEQNVADLVRVLGEDHSDTLASRSNLAGVYQAAGDLDRAIPLHEQVLADSVRILGQDHPQTLIARGNLALAYQTAGDLGRAIRLYKQNIADLVRVLGPDHPDTLTARSNLAGAYQAAGDLDRAIPLHQQILTDRQRILGEDHPGTLTSRSNLARAYQAAGDLDRAIPLHQQILTDSERILGEDHPGTVTARHSLAVAYDAAGDLDRAIPLYEQALADSVRVLGEDHPDTLASRSNLAGAYLTARDLGRAIRMQRQILADRQRVLGPDHPDILNSRHNLAVAYLAAGNLGRAIPLHEQTVADSARILGQDHPHTLASRHSLAGAYQATGELSRAIPLHQQILADRQRVLRPGPPRHPELSAQPRCRLSGRRGPRPGHPPLRAGAHRQRTDPGRRPPPNQDHPRQPCCGAPPSSAIVPGPLGSWSQRSGLFPRRPHDEGAVPTLTGGQDPPAAAAAFAASTALILTAKSFSFVSMSSTDAPGSATAAYAPSSRNSARYWAWSDSFCVTLSVSLSAATTLPITPSVAVAAPTTMATVPVAPATSVGAGHGRGSRCGRGTNPYRPLRPYSRLIAASDCFIKIGVHAQQLDCKVASRQVFGVRVDYGDQTRHFFDISTRHSFAHSFRPGMCSVYSGLTRWPRSMTVNYGHGREPWISRYGRRGIARGGLGSGIGLT